MPRRIAFAAALAATLGCNALTGLGDLEKADCVEGCGATGGAAGSSGAGGSAGSAGVVSAVSVSVGRKTSCAILEDDSLWCWGANPGVEPGTVSPTPVRVDGIGTVSSVSVGLEHVCARDTVGTVWCWGRNDAGQLGDGTKTQSNVPKPVSGLPVVDSVNAGSNHTCVHTDVAVVPVQAFCWGSNSYGQIGDGTTTDATTPVKLDFADGAQIFRLGPGDAYTCAVVDDGGNFEARCWGKNDKGQCGQDPSADPVVNAPTAVPGLPAVERIYPGFEHVCSRTVGTRVPWCWGANEFGQIGIGTTGPFEPATTVIGNLAIDTMVPAYRHTCLSTQGDRLGWCWGANNFGQFGGAPGPDQPTPIREPAIDGLGFSMRRAEHTCVVLANGGVRCWGANDSGQIGNGKVEPFSGPSDVVFGP